MPELVAAVCVDDASAVREHIQRGFRVNYRNHMGATVSLATACRLSGTFASLTPTICGKPPSFATCVPQMLHRACRLGSHNVVRELLIAGAEPRLCDDDGKTVLHDACWSSKPNFEVIRMLLDRVSLALRVF